MYQALYRKWRPKTFDDVVGQTHITETLKHQVQTGRLSHAYLFIGTRGTGKTTCAKILAKAVNCENPVNGNPCNRCAACRGIDDGSVLDVVELDAASNNGVDNVRALRDEAVFSPANVKKRVYIIDEVHMLSTSAFNALLKILEEPPEHLMFILATTELHKVPATILSRCQRHSFKRIPAEQIAARLQYVAGQEQIDLQDDAAALLARLADGGMRDALTLLDQCSGSEHVTTEVVLSAMGLAGHLRTAELLRCIAAGDTAQALVLFRQLWQDGKDPSALLDELSVLLRDVLMQTVAPRGGAELLSGGYDAATLDAFAKEIRPAQLLANIRCIQAALADMALNPNPRMGAELCLIRLCRPELQDDPPALRARLERLEQAVQSGAIPAQSAQKPQPQSKPAPAPELPVTPERPPFPEQPPQPSIPAEAPPVA
ncbi:MAG: DNA polymerase III subunit gamma/tau, partial [Oscillospiraceae bacterium]|nr:DNA polymerase III subunit gamma/tau [Oscillospiraceae bacterium]